MNVTLSLDDDLVEKARTIARAQGTTLNQMIRDHLEHVTGDSGRIRAADRHRELRRTSPGDSGGARFSRDETEDLTHGRTYAGVRVENPFREMG